MGPPVLVILKQSKQTDNIKVTICTVICPFPSTAGTGNRCPLIHSSAQLSASNNTADYT